MIKQFYEAGCRNLQLDDCTWGAIVGDAAKQRYKLLGNRFRRGQGSVAGSKQISLWKASLRTWSLHPTYAEGIYHSTFFASGRYDSVADYVFAKENVDALFLEYDDARSGGFEPLSKVSSDKKVVLGLITTKTPELENKEDIIARIYEAAKYIPLDRLVSARSADLLRARSENKPTKKSSGQSLSL